MPASLYTRLCLVALALMIAWPSAMARAAVSARLYVPTVPQDMQNLDFFLTTAGVGHEVNDRFGHTGIRVINRQEGTDVVYNWGQFTFTDPTFLWKFFRGQLDYSMGVRTLQHDVALYRRMGRQLRMEHLNLSAKQKRFLIEKIAWNAVPDHRTFSYQYWYKNCSTIPRDYLNLALGGAIFAHYGALPAKKVYRDYVRTNLGYVPFVVPLLDTLMNGNIDRPISAWEDMFLPANLRYWLLQMPAIDDAGVALAGMQLLGDSSVLNAEVEDFEPFLNDYAAVVLPLLLFLILALGLFLRQIIGRPAVTVIWAYRALGAATLYWGLLGGLIGFILLTNWCFSGHPDGWHNANLLIFWPIDAVFVPLGWRLLRTGAPLFGTLRWLDLRRFCLLHAVSLGLLCALGATQVVQQNIWRTMLWFGLPLALLLLLLGSFGASPPPRSRRAV